MFLFSLSTNLRRRIFGLSRKEQAHWDSLFPTESMKRQEAENLQKIITSTPEKEPVREDYVTDLSYLQAVLAYRIKNSGV